MYRWGTYTSWYCFLKPQPHDIVYRWGTYTSWYCFLKPQPHDIGVGACVSVDGIIYFAKGGKQIRKAKGSKNGRLILYERHKNTRAA